MSKNKKNNKKIRNNYTLEALEPRLMLSATANEAVQDYITSTEFAEQIVDYVKNNVKELNQGTVEIDGQSLSINDLLGKLDTSNVNFDLEKDDSGSYTVKMDNLVLNKSIENLSVDVNGQTVTGLKGTQETTVKIDSLTMQITEEDNDFTVESAALGDVSLESNIVIDEAEKSVANDGYLNLVEQKNVSESGPDLKIKVSSDKNEAKVDVESFDPEFDVDSPVVTFDPDMKVDSSSSDFSNYDNLTLKTGAVDKSISNLRNLSIDCIKPVHFNWEASCLSRKGDARDSIALCAPE